MTDGFFDWSLYGTLIRHYRVKIECKNISSFSELIERRTYFKISKDALYRIEQNRQEPTAMQFMAINLTLFGKMYDERLAALILDMGKSK